MPEETDTALYSFEKAVAASQGEARGIHVAEPEARNMRLLAHHDLDGFGNGGEGMGLHQAADGRRTLFIAHWWGPRNFTAVDVTDPSAPRVVAHRDLPHRRVRSNSLSIAGDLMAVAYQVDHYGDRPAGLEIFDISEPARPEPIGFFDASGATSRGVHFVWFVDGRAAYLSTGMPDWEPRRPLDDQFAVIVDLSDPTRPREAGRWWLPGTRKGDPEELLIPPDADDDVGYRVHNINVYPERPDRAYVAYIEGGVVILDIADPSQPKAVSRFDYHPPMRAGMTHTIVPLFARDLLLVADETTVPEGRDHPKPIWLMDAREETSLLPLSTLPMPDVDEFRRRGGRFGAHNLHENQPLPTSWQSDTLVFATFFNAGVRAFDIANPLRPEEVGCYVPEAPAGSRYGAAQMNDLYVDENRVIYAIEHVTGGLYVLELTEDDA